MAAIVTNHGGASHFPTFLGDVFLGTKETRRVENDRLAEELAKFPDVQITTIKVVAKPRRKVDLAYDGWPIQLLRRRGARLGIARTFFMKKAELINALGKRS